MWESRILQPAIVVTDLNSSEDISGELNLTEYTFAPAYDRKNGSLYDRRTEHYYSSIMAIIGLASTFVIVLVTAYRYFLHREVPAVYSTRALNAMISARQQQLISLRRLRLLEQLFLQAEEERLDENSELCRRYRIRFANRTAELCEDEDSMFSLYSNRPIRMSDPPDYNELIGCGIIEGPPPDYESVVGNTDLRTNRNAIVSNRTTVSDIPSTAIMPVPNSRNSSNALCRQTINSLEECDSRNLGNNIEASITSQVQECRNLIQQAMRSVDRISSGLNASLDSQCSQSHGT